MKILILSNFFPPEFLGGYELGCAQVVEQLRQQGHNVQVLCSIAYETLVPATEPGVMRTFSLANLYYGVQIADAHRRLVQHQARVSHFPNVYQLLQTLRWFKPDVVYCFNLLGLGGLGILDALDSVGVPWVWHLMDRVPAQLVENVSDQIRLLFSCGQGNFSKGTHISMSQVLLDEIDSFNVQLGDRIHIVPGWVTPLSPNLPKRTYAPEGITRFVFAGGINSNKGVDLILDAASHLREEGVKQFCIDLYGSGDVQKYVAIAARLGISEQVRFMGSCTREKLLEKYQNYDALLFPSWEREPFGFVPIEAAAEGCAVIMTRQVGAAERLVGGVHCLKANRIAQEISGAMRQLIGDRGLLESLAQRGCAFVRQDLSLSKLGANIETILYASTRAIKWDAVDWEQVYRLAFLKDQTSLFLLSTLM
ncbi:MAG: hypothetical protein Fur0046_14050 [Cyanobacteria bacterium J069]